MSDTDPLVVRSEFSTTGTGVAEDFLGRGYTSETKATITGFATSRPSHQLAPRVGYPLGHLLVIGTRRCR